MGIYKNEPKDMDGFKSKQFSLFLKKNLKMLNWGLENEKKILSKNVFDPNFYFL